LESLGYAVYLVPPQLRFGQADMFGLWDLVAFKDGTIVWGQVKTNRKPGKAYLKRLTDFNAPGEKWLILFKDRVKNPIIFRL
jgi:hypothetical protein